MCARSIHYIAFTEVAPWTIDLPEVRKYHFEKAEKYQKNKDFSKEDRFFDNIVPDSPHNKHELEHYEHEENSDEEINIHEDKSKYAGDFEYMNYMEKKVHGIVQNGSVYLEGLRRSLEQYGELLKRCERLNITQPQTPNGPWLPQNERPLPPSPPQPLPPLGPSPSDIANQPPANSPNLQPNVLPGFEQPGASDQPGANQDSLTGSNRTFFNQPSLSNQRLDGQICERATRASEHVRRLAELAMWATRELQDRAYAQEYEKNNPDEEEEEMELLIRLAFFLDRLAYYTGYEPDAKDFVAPETTTRPPTTTLPPLSAMGDIPDDVKTLMMERENSSEPAPERCRYPLPHPQWMKTVMNVSDAPGIVEPLSTEPNDIRNPTYRDALRNPSFPGFRRSKRDILTVLRNRSEVTAVKTRQKRSGSDDPLLHVMKYYVKHKVWTNSNPGVATENSAELDVGNVLPTIKPDVISVRNDVYKSVQKRSIEHKKYEHLRLPENPAQDLSSYVKHRSGVNYIKDDNESAKIRQYLDKIRYSDRKTAKKLVQKLEKSIQHVQKRSIEPEKKVLPSRSQNPSQDISYYVKNKPGTDYQNNLVQAAQARAGLEQAFQTGNIEVVRRFGSNYNPLIPFPLGFGVARSFYLDL